MYIHERTENCKPVSLICLRITDYIILTDDWKIPKFCNGIIIKPTIILGLWMLEDV